MKDSALTVHGSLQAERLARHFAATGVRPSQIFSSDLQRAYKTAEAVLLEQSKLKNTAKDELKVVQLPILREQDFGFYEGKPFYARPRDSNRPVFSNHRSQHLNRPGIQDVESKEAMAQRMNSFLDEYILPQLQDSDDRGDSEVCIVSHGMILSTLWKCLLKRFRNQSVRLGDGLEMRSGPTTLEHIGAWSNTGYLLLDIHPLTKSTSTARVSNGEKSYKSEIATSDTPGDLSLLLNHAMVIKAVNNKGHLQGLKRTGGGVGSSKFDEGQKTIESFFKKRRV